MHICSYFFSASLKCPSCITTFLKKGVVSNWSQWIQPPERSETVYTRVVTSNGIPYTWQMGWKYSEFGQKILSFFLK